MGEKILRQAKVDFSGQTAGYLWETPNGFRFLYDENYLHSNGCPISVSLPLRKEPYESKELFSFFRGLLPEGWYLDIVSTTAKIDERDFFGLLLATTQDTIGAV
ncbi:MAG: HipA N-terminal domain-containing protein, partial [Candidatus Omnitrophica bacterium]|nr:HipA N-terminal domain-containing protein [Candidatus Omnitrophota bacterium]